MIFTKANIIGLVEKVTIIGNEGKYKSVAARIDTGAVISSVDAKLAAEMSLGPIMKTKKVKNANGVAVRPIVKCKFKIKGEEYITEVTIADRKRLKYRILIGQNLLKKTKLYINPRKKTIL